MEIRYNCVKRYHALYINRAKGIIFRLVTGLYVFIFFTHLPSSFFNNLVNQENEGSRLS